MLAFAPQRAYADERCDAYVVDDANIFGSQKDTLAASVKSLQDVGADGRVVAIQSFGNAGSLDTYVDQMARGCASWQMSGKLKQNFFVLAISMNERKTTIYYGTLWKSRFDTKASTIQSVVMAPEFKKSKYADGMIAGVDEIKKTIRQTADTPQGGGTVTAPSVPSTPFDWVLFWIIVGLVVGLVSLVLLIIKVIVPLVAERRQTNAVRDEAKALKNRCVETLAGLMADVDNPRFIDYFEDFAVIGGDTQSAAKNARVKARELITQAEAKIKSVKKTGDFNTRQTYVVYHDLNVGYTSVLKLLLAARAQLDSIDTQHDELLARANAASEAVSDLQEKVADANTSLIGLRQSGLDAKSLEDELLALNGMLDERRMMQGSSAIALITELPSLKSRVTNAAAAVSDTQNDFNICQSMLASLPALHQAAVDKRVPAGEAFQRMSTQYAPSSWENIKGNGSKADKLLFRAKEMLDKVSGAALTDMSQLKATTDTLEDIEKMINQGAALHDDIIARERNIFEAQQTAEQEIASAQADINKADAYIKEHSQDVDQKLDGVLDESRTHLDNARQELAKEKPNYLVVVKQALLANGAADDVFSKATEEHEYLESVRRQLETARSLFATSSDKSDRYISSNRSEVGNQADHLLKKARETFARLDRQRDEVAMLDTAKRALELANSAYDQASSEVAAAEEARQQERRRREEEEEKRRRERRRREDEEQRRQSSYYSSSSSYSSSSTSYSAPSVDFGGSSGSSGW